MEKRLAAQDRSRTAHDRPHGLTIAEIRDGLAKREFSALELTEAYLAAIEAANPLLNAYIVVTPERRAPWQGVRRAAGDGRGAGARRHTARHQGSLLHERRPQPGRQPHPRRLQADLRIDRHGEPLGRRRGDARQAQHGRVRHGLVQRDLLLRPGRQPVAEARRQCRPRARRLVGRLGGGRRGASLRRRDRDRYRRLDPPARRLHRHRRHQADLWPLLALGHRRLRLLARPGRPDRARRARRRDPVESPWRRPTRRTPPRPTSRCRTTRRRSARASRA